MGGAVGHLAHLWDNHELTFAEIKDVIRSAADGKLERVTEKLDGLNIVFSFDVSANELRVARSAGDIKRGGMDAVELAKKFHGRGNIEDAFNKAFVVVSRAISVLSPATKAEVFGENADRWFSMEVIYAGSQNVISYDGNNVVFHGWPVFTVDEVGRVTHDDKSDGIDILTSKIDQMQAAIGTREWKINGPSLVTMKKLSDGTVVKRALGQIDSIMSSVGVRDNDTVYDYLRILFNEEAAQVGFPDDIMEMVVERCIGVLGALGVPDIKRAAPRELHDAIAAFVRSSEKMKRESMLPLEIAITAFAVEVLRGIDSTLVADSAAEVARLRQQVSRAIRAIESSNNDTAMEILQKEMSRLGSIENVSAALEGIVFFYKGNPYKFTASFAPVNQILGLFQYGRPGVPPMKMPENRSRSISTVLTSVI